MSVVICTYDAARWGMLCQAVASVRSQSGPPIEIIVCVDHNDALLEACHRRWPLEVADHADIPIRIIANRYDGHLGSARNTAIGIATGDIVAFLDDDAAAERDWLEILTRHYDDPTVVAVGGAPMPVFETARPRWFPLELDWVFGCAYSGLPESAAPLRHLIGANMSVRRKALDEVGGFHSDNHDDMDMCHRVANRRTGEVILYEPNAIVRHFVTAERVTWHYFWRRCFFVNKGKVYAFRSMGDASNLAAERDFVVHALSGGLLNAAKETLRGDFYAAIRAGALLAGIGLAGFGHLAGRLDRRVKPSRPYLSEGGVRSR